MFRRHPLLPHPNTTCSIHIMPAERKSFSAARPVKTERTHEENQERYVVSSLIDVTSLTLAVLTLLLLVAATVAWKRALSLRAELLKFTRSAQVAPCESLSKMSLMKRCMRRKMMIFPPSIRG